MTAEELKITREAAGLTKGGFANTLGITAMLQGRYESGNVAIPDEIAEKIMQLYAPKKDTAPVKEEKTEASAKKGTARRGRRKKTEEPVTEAVEEQKMAESAPVAAEEKTTERTELASVADETEKEQKGKAVPKRKASRKKSTSVVVQSLMGGEITVEEILGRVKAGADNVETIYVKPEENRLYFTNKGKAEYIQIWD